MAHADAGVGEEYSHSTGLVPVPPAGRGADLVAGPFPLDRGECERKAFLGGYRDRRSGVEYHHAFSQTPVERVSKWAGKAPRIERETQTADAATRSAQTKRECSAQTGRHDLLLDTTHDSAKLPRPYFTAAQLLEVKQAKALVVQCHWRGYISRKRAREIRAGLEAQRDATGDTERCKAEEADAAYASDVRRRLDPRTKDDFAILYDEVEAWRVSETAKIKAATGGDESAQREALATLLSKQTALLGNIEVLRSHASRINSESRVSRRLSSMAAPKGWALRDGAQALVHTPYTTRAQELAALYDGLGMDALAPADRLELLQHVRATAVEFDCTLSREIAALVDREAEMLARGRPAQAQAGVRRRLRTLFLAFAETPTFNPEAARFAAAAAGGGAGGDCATLLRTKCLNTAVADADAGGAASASSRATTTTARPAMGAGSVSFRDSAAYTASVTKGAASSLGGEAGAGGGVSASRSLASMQQSSVV